MKKSELRQIVKEELKTIIKEEQFNEQRLMIDLTKAIMGIVKKHQDASPKKQSDPKLSNLSDVVAHSALNVVTYLSGGRYTV